MFISSLLISIYYKIKINYRNLIFLKYLYKKFTINSNNSIESKGTIGLGNCLNELKHLKKLN